MTGHEYADLIAAYIVSNGRDPGKGSPERNGALT